MPIEITPVSGMEQLERWVALHNEIRPDDPDTAGHKVLLRAQEGDRVELLACLDGVPVGTAVVTGDAATRETGRPWIEVDVLPAYRGQGVGDALLRAASDHASRFGRTGLASAASLDDPASIMFLKRRGFAEYRRWEQLELANDAHGAGDPTPPAGIEIASVLDRPELLESMHRVAVEVYPALGGYVGHHAKSFVDWQVYTLGGPAALLDLALMAVADDGVVGFGTAKAFDATTAELQMVAVLPEWRRRGVGTALIATQVVRATHPRLVAWLPAGTEPGRVFRGLGFRDAGGAVELHGPLQ